jgi:ribosomal protein S3AE
MFISRKKFEEAIQKAREETAEKFFQDRRTEEIYREMSSLEKRIYNLEHPNGEKVEKTIKPVGME